MQFRKKKEVDMERKTVWEWNMLDIKMQGKYTKKQ